MFTPSNAGFIVVHIPSLRNSCSALCQVSNRRLHAVAACPGPHREARAVDKQGAQTVRKCRIRCAYNKFQLRPHSTAARHRGAKSPLLPAVASLKLVVAQADMDDRSDILGGQLHVARPDPIFVLSGPSFSGTMFYGILLIAVFAGLYSLTPHYRQYQEQRYRRYASVALRECKNLQTD